MAALQNIVGAGIGVGRIVLVVGLVEGSPVDLGDVGIVVFCLCLELCRVLFLSDVAGDVVALMSYVFEFFRTL